MIKKLWFTYEASSPEWDDQPSNLEISELDDHPSSLDSEGSLINQYEYHAGLSCLKSSHPNIGTSLKWASQNEEDLETARDVHGLGGGEGIEDCVEQVLFTSSSMSVTQAQSNFWPITRPIMGGTAHDGGLDTNHTGPVALMICVGTTIMASTLVRVFSIRETAYGILLWCILSMMRPDMVKKRVWNKKNLYCSCSRLNLTTLLFK